MSIDLEIDTPRTFPFWGYALVAAMLVLLTGLLELKMGRLLICKCGHIRFWVDTADGPETSQQIADWYSFSHIIHGIVTPDWLGGPRALLPHIDSLASRSTPYVINLYRHQTAALGYSGHTVLNSMCDIACAIIGFIIARKSPVWLTIALVIAMEAICAICIRDNLFLNIVMLIHPFEFIKHWQMGG